MATDTPNNLITQLSRNSGYVLEVNANSEALKPLVEVISDVTGIDVKDLVKGKFSLTISVDTQVELDRDIGLISISADYGIYEMRRQKSTLEEQGYRVSPLNFIQTPALPVDADIIALVGPQNTLLPGEVKLLQHHRDQQKSLLVLLSSNTHPQMYSL